MQSGADDAALVASALAGEQQAFDDAAGRGGARRARHRPDA